MTWAVFAAGAFQYTCSSKISDGGVKIADGQGTQTVTFAEMQVHDGPRFMANDNIIFAHDMFFLIRALRTESQITAYHSDIVDTLLRTREPFFRDP